MGIEDRGLKIGAVNPSVDAKNLTDGLGYQRTKNSPSVQSPRHLETCLRYLGIKHGVTPQRARPEGVVR